MSDVSTEVGERFGRDDVPASTGELDHVTVANDDGPDECVLFPQEASDAELMTTWIAAFEGSYVDLESAR